MITHSGSKPFRSSAVMDVNEDKAVKPYFDGQLKIPFGISFKRIFTKFTFYPMIHRTSHVFISLYLCGGKVKAIC